MISIAGQLDDCRPISNMFDISERFPSPAHSRRKRIPAPAESHRESAELHRQSAVSELKMAFINIDLRRLKHRSPSKAFEN